jgi:hypothetical protein
MISSKTNTSNVDFTIELRAGSLLLLLLKVSSPLMNYSMMNLQIDKKASLPVQAMSSDPPKPRGNKIK